MPVYVMRALFVLTGLMLLRQLYAILRRTRPSAVRALLHAVMGLAALLMSNTVGALFGAQLGLNALTLPVCAALGVPGTALLWALRCFL